MPKRMNNKGKFSADTITAFAAVIIALIALALGILDHSETRKHDRLSVVPRLTYDYLLASVHQDISIEISNNGLGPAIVKEFNIYMDGKKLEDFGARGWLYAMELLLNVLSETAQPNVFFFNSGDTMKRGDTKKLISFSRENLTQEDMLVIIDFFSRLSINIKYESLYGDTYAIDINETKLFLNEEFRRIISKDI